MQIAVFDSTTNSDGRVTEWVAQDRRKTLEQVFRSNSGFGSEVQSWSIKFEVEKYWQQRGFGECFFGDVEIAFKVRRKDEHYHVPLLLGPYSYSTYRGS